MNGPAAYVDEKICSSAGGDVMTDDGWEWPVIRLHTFLPGTWHKT